MNEQQIEYIHTLIQQGVPVVQIAAQLGMSYRKMQLQLARAGYTIECRQKTERTLVKLENAFPT